MAHCILHVDDDPDIRDVVKLSLELDPTFTIISCASGADGLAIVKNQAPDLILCDFRMPGMDGATLLARLQESDITANIPIVFLTACAGKRELEELKALGATDVITKPFDPNALAKTVRQIFLYVGLAAASRTFTKRLRNDATTLSAFREKLRSESGSSVVLNNLQFCVHKLAGAAGVFDYHAVSTMASTLEESIIENGSSWDRSGRIEANLDALIECIARE